MYGYVFNAIKLGFYSDFEKRSWYIICTSAKVPEDYDDYIDYEDQLFLELAVGKTYLLTLKMVLVEHNQYSRDMVDIHNMYNMYMEQHKKKLCQFTSTPPCRVEIYFRIYELLDWCYF